MHCRLAQSMTGTSGIYDSHFAHVLTPTPDEPTSGPAHSHLNRLPSTRSPRPAPHRPRPRPVPDLPPRERRHRSPASRLPQRGATPARPRRRTLQPHSEQLLRIPVGDVVPCIRQRDLQADSAQLGLDLGRAGRSPGSQGFPRACRYRGSTRHDPCGQCRDTYSGEWRSAFRFRSATAALSDIARPEDSTISTTGTSPPASSSFSRYAM